MMQVGVLSSALEHSTPEQMFNDPTNPTDAISAVKALQIAAAQGQRTYQISQANIDSVLPLLNLSANTEAEIMASVNAGLEVITHTDQVSVPGYTGEGYIIIDTETGSGAYKIGGGQNGAFTALDYIITALDIFYGFISALTSTLGPVSKLLNSISNVIKTARFVHDLLTTNEKCSLATVAILLFTMFTVIGLAFAQVATTLSNPLVGFGMGAIIDKSVDTIMGLSSAC